MDLGVTIDRDIKFHSHARSNVLDMGALVTNLLRFFLRNVDYIGDFEHLEKIQCRWTKAVAGMDELPYVERLTWLNLYPSNEDCCE